MNQNTALLIIDVQVVLFAREKYDGQKIYNSELLLNNIIEHHNGIMGGKNPYAEKFAELKKTAEVEF